MERKSAIEGEMLALIRERGALKSVCPSEVARRVDPENWRALMPEVRVVARSLLRGGLLRVTQGARELDSDETWSGAIRLRMKLDDEPVRSQ